MKAPADAARYYDLDEKEASFRDIILSIRADEAVHRSSNHHFSDIPADYDIEDDEIKLSNADYKGLKEKELKELEMIEEFKKK